MRILCSHTAFTAALMLATSAQAATTGSAWACPSYAELAGQPRTMQEDFFDDGDRLRLEIQCIPQKQEIDRVECGTRDTKHIPYEVELTRSSTASEINTTEVSARFGLSLERYGLNAAADVAASKQISLEEARGRVERVSSQMQTDVVPRACFHTRVELHWVEERYHLELPGLLWSDEETWMREDGHFFRQIHE
ncbi:MAG TPA: hypothetical protein VLA56_16535 [Pseudomonadales bacterium]|nr:hypothetical protein [Pseudomonadales bacterium]